MRERVLVVDDAQDIRHFLSEYILKPKGFEVLTATNGLEGLALALSKNPDLLIVDNQMPRMSGLELLQRLSDRGLQVPTILTTAHGSEAIAVEGFRLGIRDYVIKPFDTEEMNAAIERALREARLQRERDKLLQQLMESNTQLEKRLKELNILYAIGKTVSSSLELEQVLHRVVEAAVYVTGAEEGFLMLVDPDEGELYVRASKNVDSATQSMRLRVRDSLAGRVLESKRPLVLGGDEDSEWQRIKTSYLVKSVIYVPMHAHNRPIGVLTVANRTRELPFANRDTRVLTALADYAAVAIANANLYSQTDQERRKLGTVLSQTDDPIVLVDEDGTLAMVNDAARFVLKLPPGELLGRRIDALITDEEFLAFIQQPAGKNLTRHAEYQSQDGRVFDANMTLIEGVGRSLLLHDITQLKELDRLKSDFVATVSHDLRSPLTAIVSYTDLLARTGPLNEKQHDFVGRIHKSVHNITGLISDLLDLGRIEAGLDLALAPCALVELLQEAAQQVQPLAQRKKLHLVLALPDDLPLVYGDRNRLHQCFSNLILNAIKYTPEDGAITLSGRCEDGQVMVEVSDTGIGISPADQPYVFDKFFRSSDVVESYEGTGLGLSIVKSVVERHHGRVWVNSEWGQGATFTILLPAVSRRNAR